MEKIEVRHEVVLVQQLREVAQHQQRALRWSNLPSRPSVNFKRLEQSPSSARAALVQTCSALSGTLPMGDASVAPTMGVRH